MLHAKSETKSLNKDKTKQCVRFVKYVDEQIFETFSMEVLPVNSEKGNGHHFVQKINPKERCEAYLEMILINYCEKAYVTNLMDSCST